MSVSLLRPGLSDVAAADEFAAHARTARQLAQDLSEIGDKRNYVRPDVRSALAAAVASARFCGEMCRRLADEHQGRGGG